MTKLTMKTHSFLEESRHLFEDFLGVLGGLGMRGLHARLYNKSTLHKGNGMVKRVAKVLVITSGSRTLHITETKKTEFNTLPC